MGVKQILVCDKCGIEITDDDPGVFVHGNIYNANPKNIEERGGLVGDNFNFDQTWRRRPVDEERYGGVSIRQVGETDAIARENCFHLSCLVELLDCNKKYDLVDKQDD